MKVTVNGQLQTFWLAHNDGWKKAVGHGVRVGEYQFCVIPLQGKLNVTEVTTGLRAMQLPIYPWEYDFMSDKASVIEYIREAIGEELAQRIPKYKDFSSSLKKQQKAQFERLGERPPVEDYHEQVVEQ